LIQFWKAEIKKISLKEGLYANLEDQSGHFTETKKKYYNAYTKKVSFHPFVSFQTTKISTTTKKFSTLTLRSTWNNFLNHSTESHELPYDKILKNPIIPW